jgi:hypothetical protein
MHIELTDEEVAILRRELTDITFSDRYPLSPRIKALNTILAKLSSEPAREPSPSPPPQHFEPPSKGRYRRRR